MSDPVAFVRLTLFGIGIWIIARQLLQALERRRHRRAAIRGNRDPTPLNVVELLQIGACISGVVFLGAFALTVWANAPRWLVETCFALFLLSGLEALVMELIHTRLEARARDAESPSKT